jgi:transcriptional regulator with XRE-family HTH domain
MVTDQGPVVQSVLLRSELRRLRNESGLTQEQVAYELDWSPSKVIRVETAGGSAPKADRDAPLARSGVPLRAPVGDRPLTTQRGKLHFGSHKPPPPAKHEIYTQPRRPILLA